MSPVLTVRKRLRMTQKELAVELEVSQGNVSFYESGQTVPPAVAAKLIELAKSRGMHLTFDHVYGADELPAEAEVKAA